VLSDRTTLTVIVVFVPDRRRRAREHSPNSDRHVADLSAAGSAALSTSADQGERLDSGMTATASVWVATSDGTVTQIRY
jgi:hypothetical protein